MFQKGKKKDASGIAPSKFSRAQQAEDTEREMTGKPQRFGAATSDEPETKMPDIKGALDPDVNDSDADDVPQQDDSGDPQTEIAQLKAHNAELEQRLSALEAHTGIKKQVPAQAAEPQDDDEYLS